MKFLLIFLTIYIVLRYVLPLLIRLIFADLLNKQQKNQILNQNHQIQNLKKVMKNMVSI